MLAVLRDAVRARTSWWSAPGRDDVVIGRYADGDAIALPIGLSALVAGLPGSGKSSTLRAIVAGLLERDDTAVVAIDGKGGIEAAVFEPALAAPLAVDQCDALELAGLVATEVDRRARLLRAEGLTSWPASPDRPRLVLVVDELAVIAHTGDRAADLEVVHELARVAALGRAVGVSMIAATQRPSAEVVPAWLRDVIPTRVAHALARRVDGTMILGDLDGAGAESLPLGDPGAVLVLAEGDRVARRGRVRWVDPQRLTELAARPRPWPWSSTARPTTTSIPTTASIPTAASTSSSSTASTTSTPGPWPAPILTPSPMAPAERPEPTPKAPAATTTPGPALSALQRRVLAAVVEAGPASVPALAARLAAPERRVRECCAELAAVGLLDRTGTRWTAR